MKKFKTILAIGLFALTTTLSYAQTADEIVNKYLTTIGGADKLRAIKAVKMEGVANGGGMEIPMEITQTATGKQLMKMTFQGKEIVPMGYDGATLWGTNFMTMKAEKSDAEATENFKQEAQDFPDTFLDYQKKGYKVEYVGKETKEGTETYKLKVTKKPIKVSGVSKENIVYYYIDTADNIIVMSESEIPSGPMAGQKNVSKFSDYQEVEGIYFPFSINSSQGEMKVKKITINPTIDDKVFAFPAQ